MSLYIVDNPEVIKKSMLNRMYNNNDYIVKGMASYFWANVNHPGCLIEGCSWEETTILFQLIEDGIVKHETKQFYV